MLKLLSHRFRSEQISRFRSKFRCVQQHDQLKVSAMSERRLHGLWNRVLQILARVMAGATSTRVRLNRWRGGQGVSRQVKPC